MGIVVVGLLLIVLAALVLSDVALHRAMEEPTRHHPVPSPPEKGETAATESEDKPSE